VLAFDVRSAPQGEVKARKSRAMNGADITDFIGDALSFTTCIATTGALWPRDNGSPPYLANANKQLAN
jgi:hypothetical protein